MAEALAVVGLVSAIVQFVEFGTKVVSRLHEFLSSVNDMPKTFQDINNRLPIVIDSLKRTQPQADAHEISDETAEALKPAMDGCVTKVKLLEKILAKSLSA